MSPIEFYDALENISLADFGRLFSEVQRSAFRLELLQQFIVEDEVDPFNKFKQGQKSPPPGFNKPWTDLISSYARKGISFTRVRYVTRPLTLYTQFEFAWAYLVNMDAGEQIKVVAGDGLPQFESPVPILKDFWMFDEKRLILMEYDVVGRFLGAKSVPAHLMTPYFKLVNEAKQVSQQLDLKDYV